MPQLRLILGPMFAGKSSSLIDIANKLIDKGINKNQILLINHGSDKRYNSNSKICTHDGKTMESIALTNMMDIFNNEKIDISKIKCIFIDEGQFFNDLYEVVKLLLLTHKKNICICGLDGDFEQKPFNDSRLLDLIPYASDIIKLTTKCYKCNNSAPFTKRIINSNEKILVGGAEDYQPVCINHLQ